MDGIYNRFLLQARLVLRQSSNQVLPVVVSCQLKCIGRVVWLDSKVKYGDRVIAIRRVPLAIETYRRAIEMIPQRRESENASRATLWTRFIVPGSAIWARAGTGADVWYGGGLVFACRRDL